MSYRSSIQSGVSLVVAATLFLLAGCGGQSEPAAARGKDVRAATGRAQFIDVPHTVTATGSLQAGTTVMVSTRMMGWVRKIHVGEGQRVARGDLLVSIDGADLQAKKAQAEAGIIEAKAVLGNAEAMLTRFRNLYADKSVSKQQLDDVQTGRDRAAAGLRMAEAGLAEVKVHLSYLDITAPVDGVVTRKMIEIGNMANPGMPLLSLESTGDMKVVAHLGEKDIANVQVGMPVTVDVTSLAEARFTAPLTKVVLAANPGSRTYDIEAQLDTGDDRLKSGMFARVTVPVGERRAVIVPDEAIIRRGQLTGVWLVDAEGIVHLRWIRLGGPLAGLGEKHVEVLSGLSGTETVVMNAAETLTEGDRVVN